MIRYTILAPADEQAHRTQTALVKAELAELQRLIGQAVKKKYKPNNTDWLTEAAARTATFRGQEKYSEPPKPNWSDIKRIYMKLQYNKCAYCEQKLEGGPRGPIVHDVEHYRPKNAVVGWPNAKQLQQSRFAFIAADHVATGADCNGYYLLPYHLLNYATACKICNSTLKHNYFPIAATRITNSDRQQQLKREKPYLIYPLGHLDDDPTDIITFEGVKPVPRPGLSAQQRIRALITILFFELDIRDPLIKQRSAVIKNIFEKFRDRLIHPDPERQKQAVKDLELYQRPSSEHANCARAFYALCEQDLVAARHHYDAAVDYLETHPDL
ncbi:MAG: hypothetical protein ACJ74J_12105 [Blastocatellia bacterium]